MGNHKSFNKTKPSHKKTVHQTSMKSIISNFTMFFSHSDVNGESKIIGPDKIIKFKKKTVHQTSMKSIISKFPIYFSYSDVNGES